MQAVRGRSIRLASDAPEKHDGCEAREGEKGNGLSPIHISSL
jgi:hypothetical protein